MPNLETNSNIAGRRSVWRPAVLLATLNVIVFAYVAWLLTQTLSNERLGARTRMTEAYTGYAQAAADRLQADWEQQLGAMESLADTFTMPSVAFEAFVEQGFADSVCFYSPDGALLYPQMVVATTPGATLQEEPVLVALHSGDWHKVAALFREIDGDTFKSSLNASGRVAALSLAQLVLDAAPATETDLVGEITRRLVEALTDYQNDAIPASQRRYLMKWLGSRVPVDTFPTLAAEDLAARHLLARTPSEAGVLTSSGAYLHPNRSFLLLFTPGRIDTAFREAVRSLKMPTGAELRLVHGVGVVPMSGVWNGWGIQLELAPNQLSAFAHQRTFRHLMLASAALVALTFVSVMVIRSLHRETLRARLEHDLAATISHELRTPLASMRLLVDVLLADEEIDPGKVREYLDIVAKENARLSHLVENFLAFSRLERRPDTLRQEPLDARSVLEESALTAQRTFAGQRVRLEFPDKLRSIRGDRAGIVTALLNLLSNACKYSPPESEVVLRGYEHVDEICFEVEDVGRGLTKRQSREVFEIFRQLDDDERGCGLGLHIVRTVTAALGGRVEVDSKLGFGSRFRIYFPAVAQIS